MVKEYSTQELYKQQLDVFFEKFLINLVRKQESVVSTSFGNRIPLRDVRRTLGLMYCLTKQEGRDFLHLLLANYPHTLDLNKRGLKINMEVILA